MVVTVYYGFSIHDASAENTYIYQQPAPQPEAVTLNDLVQALSVSKKDPLPEWKLAQYDGNPLQWHEWFGQFCSTVDAASLSDDVKLTYLKTLVTGKAKSAIAEFAYSGRMYKEALKTLERKFGQPQNVITAHLDKLSSFPQLRMHNSENIISFSMTISSLVAVFRSLDYEEDLKSVSLLNQALSKVPPNMRESWSLFVVKRNWSRPNQIDFNNWLKDKAEAHEKIKNMPGKPKVEEPSKTKAVTRVFASISTVEKKFEYPSCILCKWGNMPCGSVPCLRRKLQHNVRNSLRKTNCASPAYKGTTHSGNVPEQKNAPNQVALAPIVYFSMGLNVFFLVEIRTKMIAIQDPTLVNQHLMQSRIKPAQTLIENHSARKYQTQVRIMQTLIPFRWM